MQLKVFGFSISTLLTMKLLILLTVVACFQVSARGFGQTISISLKDAPLETAFKEIKKQSGYSFIYTRIQLKQAQPVTINIKNGDIKNVLEICFRNQPLSYLIEDRYIVVQTKQAVIEKSLPDVSSIDVSGRIINESGEALQSVTVSAKLSGKTTMTNERGEFTLAKIENNDILIATSVGYFKEEIHVDDRSYLVIRMRIAVGSLDETVVMAYGQTSRRLNTGSIVKISAEEIAKEPIANPLAALQGRSPGVTVVQSNGIPGSGFRVLIRGRNSLQQGTEPLYVIDGVPFAPNNSNINGLSSVATSNIGIGLSPFNTINPADIESIEILKDADATAIYGSRGANGVILVTTKKGKSGKAKINFSVYSGISKITRYPRLLNTQEYLTMRREAFQNDGVTPTMNTAPDLLLWDNTRYSDFAKLLIGGSAQTTDLQSSVTGGNSNTQFLLGAGLHRETTVLPGDLSDNRASFKTNINHQSDNKRFSLNFLASYSFDKNNLISTSSLVQYVNLPPNLPGLYNSDGSLKWQEGGISYENPLAFLMRKYTMKADNLLSNLQLNYKLGSSIVLRSSFGYNSFITDETSLFPKRSQNPANNPTGTSQFANGTRKSWIVEPQVEYIRYFKKHKLTALTGATIQEMTSKGTAIQASGYTDDALIQSIHGATSVVTSNDYSKYRYLAFFGRLNYNYSDKYIVNLSGRRDGSSRFGPGKRFSSFGAAGIAWIFTNEPFMRNKFPWFSYGKIRASYGITGNDQIGDYRYLDSWTNTTYPYQSTTGLFPYGLFNPDFEWESTKKLEVTTDLGFLKDRILLTATFFRNRSSNQLINYILPTQTGNQSILRNFPAVIENRGFEFLLSTRNISGKRLEWSTSINMTLPKNRLVSFPNIGQTSYRLIYVQGQPLNLIYSYKYNGVDPTTGLYVFEDIDKDGSITYPNDIKVNGSLDPKFYGGLTNSIKYKQWQFDLLFEFKKQLGQNYLSTFRTMTPGKMFNQPSRVLDRWPTNTSNPVIGKFTTQSFGPAYSAIENLLLSDGIYSDASFVRLKNISLSYSLPLAILSRIKIQSCRIYLTGQNIMTLTNFKGPDPETQYLFSLPPLKTYAAGIQLTF